MYISITGLKSKNFLSKIKFWMLAAPAFKAAQKAEGNLFGKIEFSTFFIYLKSPLSKEFPSHRGYG